MENLEITEKSKIALVNEFKELENELNDLKSLIVDNIRKDDSKNMNIIFNYSLISLSLIFSLDFYNNGSRNLTANLIIFGYFMASKHLNTLRFIQFQKIVNSQFDNICSKYNLDSKKFINENNLQNKLDVLNSIL